MNDNWIFSDIPYTRPDVEAPQARYDDLTRRARSAAAAEDLLQVVRERDALQQEVCLYQSIATIRAFHDVTDAFYQQEMQETLPRLETLDSQSLAMAMSREGYASVLNLDWTDQRLTHYLKGETISVEPGETARPDGWQLVCVSGYPLGWGKLVNGLLKNKYHPGWRMA